MLEFGRCRRSGMARIKFCALSTEGSGAPAAAALPDGRDAVMPAGRLAGLALARRRIRDQCETSRQAFARTRAGASPRRHGSCASKARSLAARPPDASAAAISAGHCRARINVGLQWLSYPPRATALDDTARQNLAGEVLDGDRPARACRVYSGQVRKLKFPSLAE